MTDRPTGPATARRLSDEDKRVLRWWAEREVADDMGYHEVAPWKIVALLDEAAERARILAALPEALRDAMAADDSEPLDAEGFCQHGLLGGVGCSEWEHSWSERVAAALAAAIEKVLG